MINLTSVFYSLIDDGYIYEEDENGYNMSYGEYTAIADYLQESARECLNGYDFLEDLESMHDTLETADDDTRMFTGDHFFEEFYDFYYDFEYDEETNTYTAGAPCPDYLADLYEEFKESHDIAA